MLRLPLALAAGTVAAGMQLALRGLLHLPATPRRPGLEHAGSRRRTPPAAVHVAGCAFASCSGRERKMLGKSRIPLPPPSPSPPAMQGPDLPPPSPPRTKAHLRGGKLGQDAGGMIFGRVGCWLLTVA